MKKFLIAAAILFGTLQLAVFADSYLISNAELVKIQTQIMQTGFKILNANNIEKRMMFTYDSSCKSINASTSIRDRTIVVCRGMYNMLDNEDELEAVLGHEISHGVDSYDGIFRGSLSWLSYYCAPKKFEYKADKRAVDFMVRAGYNPVAMIVMMNKSFSQYNYDWRSTHPLSSRRMMEVYEYIYKKYPEYLVNNKYIDNIYYQNFLLTSKSNRKKFEEKVKRHSNEKVHYL